jgi:maltooligosyltrehalose trehalohydrolase
MTHIGALPLPGNRTHFRVWAPQRERIGLHIVAPHDERIALTKTDDGYHEAIVDGVHAGAQYLFVVNDRELPDPASRFQPHGVHGPSEVVPREFAWSDGAWRGITLDDFVIYELHVGTFTDEGTFDAAIDRLDELRELGITAIELLPIAQFPGTRNWGYDGVYQFAAQNSYGGPLALKRLVDAAHARGLAVVLDVVYNHLGPEGNYLAEFGPYFTDRYKTPWGEAINFDGAQSDPVRELFTQSALQWIDEFHIDALRLDAVHAIIDRSAQPFLEELTSVIHDRRENIFIFAESNLNDPRVITPTANFGLGFDSQWSDDFHHALHALLTGEQGGYYQGFGKVSDLARVIETGYLFTGQHSPYRGRRHGAPPRTKDGAQFVVCAQNHDQIGNRMNGERLSALVSPEKLRLAAACVVLAPFIPMLFMGEEYGETAPFQYFTSHSDQHLIEAVRRGRREEFKSFAWKGEAPDPHDEATFQRSRLNWSQRDASLWSHYRDLLRLRRETPSLRSLDLNMVSMVADDDAQTLVMKRGDVTITFDFAKGSYSLSK